MFVALSPNRSEFFSRVNIMDFSSAPEKKKLPFAVSLGMGALKTSFSHSVDFRLVASADPGLDVLPLLPHWEILGDVFLFQTKFQWTFPFRAS